MSSPYEVIDASPSRGIESGFGMAMRSNENARQQAAFDAQMQDRQDLRNAMSEYGQASDNEGKQSAINKVGAVSPQMMMQLQRNFDSANESQREAMKSAMDERGSVAYVALQEKDQEKRQGMWDAYRNSLPEDIKKMVTPDATDQALTVTMAQSAEALKLFGQDRKDDASFARQEAKDNALLDRQSRQNDAYMDRLDRQNRNALLLEDARLGNKQSLDLFRKENGIGVNGSVRAGSSDRPNASLINSAVDSAAADYESSIGTPDEQAKLEDLNRLKNYRYNLAGGNKPNAIGSNAVNNVQTSNAPVVKYDGTRKVLVYPDGRAVYAEE